MRRRRSGGNVAERLLLLVSLASSGAFAQVIVSPAGLELEGLPFQVKGVLYSSTPIGRELPSVFTDAGCLYARDFPLIRAAGANAIQTRARVNPSDRAFTQVLASNDLYWLAGFPLEPYHDPSRSLSPETAGGRNLRARILDDLEAYARAWDGNERLIALVFGDRTALDYNQKFAGSPGDFYSLLAEAARRLDDAGLRVRVTTRVATAADIGDRALGTDDAAQDRLAFWSVDRQGRAALGTVFEDVRLRTAKPLLISAFGVDAFDHVTLAEDAGRQAIETEALARELSLAARSTVYKVVGGVYGDFADEWARGGDPTRHGGGGRVAPSSPDGFFNAGWTGLFGVMRTGLEGLDSLRPREAYFALARAWGGAAPDELSSLARPSLELEGLRNTASDFPVLARGGLLSLHGDALSAAPRHSAAPGKLPLHLGAVSACMDGRPVPLHYAGVNEVRGQVPWVMTRGERTAFVYRAGAASNPAMAQVEAAAPGILPRGVLRSGLPCPVDEFNGVRPGEFLEVYSTGLGAPAAAALDSGQAVEAPMAIAGTPRASWRGREFPVLYSGLFPGVVGVYQTNVQVPDELPAGGDAFRLELDGFFSNPYPLRVVAFNEPEAFGLDGPHPGEITLQEGGEARSTTVDVLGAGAFCGLVRFTVRGLPPGVEASIPVGLPGNSVELTIRALPGAPRLDRVPVTLTGSAPGLPDVSRSFFVTVLPASGDISFSVRSAGWLTGEPRSGISFNGRPLEDAATGTFGRGFTFMTVGGQSGLLGEIRTFDTWGSEDAVAAMEDYLLAIPEGDLVLGAIADDGFQLITDETRRIVRERLGSDLIDLLEYQGSWAILTRAGAERPIAESQAPDSPVSIERILSFPLE